MSNHIDQFRQAIEAAGLPAPAEIIDDGSIHRFSTNGKRGDSAGFYMLHGDGIPAGAFGCWRSGLTSTWCAKSDRDMSASERQAMRERIEGMKRQREAEKESNQAQARETAARLVQAAPATQHPYLTTKGIKPHGARSDGERLVIPMRDTDGTLHSVQTIGPDGGKLFLLGGRVSGCYFSIGKPAGRLIVCEGFATGASIHECTGHAVAVAFNAGNLQAVAVALRAKYPKLPIIIAADDDYATAGNPGLSKARQAARAVGGVVAVPDFGRAA
ncbi:toprim domain-containing protein [Noviherbaspirillum sedimenti]|uniref:Toprim domain-containing protein n=1 Tax=Noviherbaspirillum sedimenti TaxID=2320865 RepID=A0A3A3G020_9BURK|nr:toprim domain-containing protein [Noviherbaspirillum sedimenti]RJG01271.1 toprim domain-containing protein [Noviherbaspirillum sedimenti]